MRNILWSLPKIKNKRFLEMYSFSFLFGADIQIL